MTPKLDEYLKDLLGIKRDYIPGGKVIRSVISIEKISKHLLHQCAVQTNYDIQSGPIYCGDLATFVGKTKDGELACVCEKHKRVLERLLEKQ